jgi:hypothetical protein
VLLFSGKNPKGIIKKKKRKIQVNLNNIHCWTYNDAGAPYDPDIPYVLAKWTLLKVGKGNEMNYVGKMSALFLTYITYLLPLF